MKESFDVGLMAPILACNVPIDHIIMSSTCNTLRIHFEKGKNASGILLQVHELKSNVFHSSLPLFGTKLESLFYLFAVVQQLCLNGLTTHTTLCPLE